MKKILVFLYLSVCTFCAFTQTDFNDYKIQRCVGALPKGFSSESSVKAKEKMDEIDDMKLRPKEKDLRKQHIILTTFLIDAFLTSGDVLFGDPMSDYINKVADNILKDDPEFRKELQFYILKTNTPNAIATANGMIFVTTGLLARIENEAQLAFILCHEIQHYKLKHSLLQYKQARKLEEESKYADLNTAQKIRKFYHFSVMSETEADTKGYELYSKTGYAKTQIVKAFENTKFFEYPFLEREIGLSFFEDQYFKFDSVFVVDYNKKVKSTSSLYRETGFISERSKNSKRRGSSKYNTHPALDTRIETLNKLIGKDTLSGVNFSLDKGEFDAVQHQARCEELYLQLRAAEFANAFYLANAMDSEYGKSLYTSKVKAMGLYGLAKHKVRKHPLLYYGCYYNKAKGGWRNYKFFNTILDRREMQCLASRELWKLSAENNNAFINALRDDVFKEFVTLAGLSFDRLLECTGEKPKVNSELYYNYFGELLKKPEFIQYIRDEEKLEYEFIEPKKSKKNKNSLNQKLKLNSVLLFDPEYSCYEYRPKVIKRDFFREEEMKVQLAESLADVGAQNGVDITYISNSVGGSLTTESLNEYSILRDWILERLFNDTIKFITFTHAEANQISKKYNVDHVAMSVLQESRYNTGEKIGLKILISIVFPPMIPIYLMQRPNTNMYILVLNIREDNIVKFGNKSSGGKFKSKRYRSFMMKQIHKGK